MNKRRIIAMLIAFLLTIAATAMWSAATIEREGNPDARNQTENQSHRFNGKALGNHWSRHRGPVIDSNLSRSASFQFKRSLLDSLRLRSKTGT